MEKLIAAFETSGPALSDAVADVDEEVKQLAKEIGARLRCPISVVTLSGMPTVSLSLNRGIAYRDATRVALAIERYRLRHRELPKSLDDLVPEFLPEVPLDPFDGKPLRYRLEANEYKVYSIGTDGIDQGGQADESQPSMPPDFVFRVRLNERSDQESSRE